ncbi:glycyl-tRNA synthetase [Teratosphaeria nubilosa]|uniref:Glycyl-tRNA synthetase n=1 Tax=Teratosphaeria nubilosa TaxID=161662 RepID=A0A6G1LFS4_9PEZI|nr:glycyl-tRNA synthetase [Teratosphaeria nubilosa]
MSTSTLAGQVFDRTAFDAVIRRRFILSWKNMLELDCTVLTPEEVLKTSGHVDKFADWMCRDAVKGDYIRADHLLETVLSKMLVDDKQARETCAGISANKNSPDKQLADAVVKEYQSILAQIDNYDGDGLGALIERLDIRNPDGNNKVLPPIPFNLMFKSSVGPSAAAPVYLRPETAQGQFLNFRKLLEYNNNSMPFASASIGKSYATRSRREGWAVRQKVVDNETLGYFLARIQAFLLKIGVDQTKLRFRQHLPNEMAHYACDCWDAELFTSYGWIECVGCADRSAYDLTVHMQRTKDKLIVRQPLSEPRVVTEWQPRFDKRALGRTFRGSAKLIEEAVCTSDQQARMLSRLVKDMLKIEKETRTENVREYVPNVIEPSFGIGRILYSLLEHVYWYRPDRVARAVLSLPLSVAPTKVLIVPLSPQAVFTPIIRTLSQRSRKLGISNRIDDSGATIGKRYARNDELGTPLGVTIDFDTVQDGSVTLRDRDTTQQVRGSQEEVLDAIQNLVNEDETWQDVFGRLPAFYLGDAENE